MASAIRSHPRVTDATPVQGRAITIALVGAFMAILDTFIVVVAAPAIQRSLHASDAEVQLIVAGYQLTYAAGLVTGARLGDTLGRRKMFVVGMIVFTLASIGCGAAPSIIALIIARLVQGLGCAAMFPQIFSMIQVLIPPEARPRAFGRLGAVIGASTILGQIVGGALLAWNPLDLEWRSVFWVNVPVGIAAIALARAAMPETRAENGRGLDVRGASLLAASLTLLVVPLIIGRQFDWPVWSWVCLALSAVVFAVFMRAERQVGNAGGSPLVAMDLLRDKSFLLGIALVILAYAGINSFFLVLSLVLQQGFGESALGAGLVYTPLAVAFFVASLIAGRIGMRFGVQPLQLAAVISTIGFVILIVQMWSAAARANAWELLPALILVGFGNGALMTPLLNVVLSKVQPAHTGMASGLLSTGQQIGGSLGVAVMGVVFYGAVGVGGDRSIFHHAFAVSVIMSVVITLGTALLLGAVPKLTKKTPASSA